jgi:hypothetical protein
MIGCSAVRAICTSIAQLRRSGISAGNPGLCLPSSPSQPNAHGAGPAECSPACSAHRSGVVYVWAVRTCSAHSSPSAPCAPSRLPGPLFLSGAVFLIARLRCSPRVSSSFNGIDQTNKVLANRFIFDRQKATHKLGALAGPQERND